MFSSNWGPLLAIEIQCHYLILGGGVFFKKKKAKFLSPRHCEKVDVASLTPQALALGIFNYDSHRS